MFAKILIAIAALAVIGPARMNAQNAPVFWQSPFNISGDSDVSSDGTLVNAFNMNGPDVTVNDVLFSAFAITPNTNSATNGNYSFFDSQGHWVTPNLGSNQPPFSNLSTNYQTLLSTGIVSDELDSIDLTISGLTIGQRYEFQWWCNASTLDNHGFSTEAFADNLVVLDDNTTNANGGVGQSVLGTFTATGTAELISFSGVGGSGVNFPTINAFQLRAIEVVPEPSLTSVLLAAGGVIGTILFRRKG